MSKGRAKLAFSQGMSVWVLEAPEGFGDAAYHSHHAVQITVSLSGRLELADSAGALSGRVLAVAPDARHKIAGHGLLAFIFIEPESGFGRALSDRLFRHGPLAEMDDPDFVRLVEPLIHAFEAPLSQDLMLRTARAAMEAITRFGERPGPDARIRRIIDHAASHPGQPLGLVAESAGVYLSPSRLRHLFVEQTGLAFKTYMLWQRLVRAVELYSNGVSLTEAAHAAGFADSAHFSRVFKRTFGLPATTLTRL
jgi:AraC-like DNA-binding protein